MTMANACIQYTEDMVGQNHATKSDTLNRLVVGINNFRLIKSGANLTLEAVNGNLVDINGKIYAVTTIPTIGVGGLSASTLYYIYLYDSSGTATLEASATGYTVDSSGRANKTGTATKRLMGLGYTTAGTAWADTAAQRFVRSWDNDRGVSLRNSFTTARATSSASLVELNTEIRVEFVSLPGDLLHIGFVGSAQVSAALSATSALGIDGTAPEDSYQYTSGYTTNAQVSFNAGIARSDLATGYHYATGLGSTSTGTTTWFGSGSAGTRCVVIGTIQRKS